MACPTRAKSAVDPGVQRRRDADLGRAGPELGGGGHAGEQAAKTEETSKKPTGEGVFDKLTSGGHGVMMNGIYISHFSYSALPGMAVGWRVVGHGSEMVGVFILGFQLIESPSEPRGIRYSRCPLGRRRCCSGEDTSPGKHSGR